MRVGQTRKRDQNEAEIVDALRRIGVAVFYISGKGLPDLLCYHKGIWLPLEVKTERGERTMAQEETGRIVRIPIVRTVDEALSIFAMIP